MAEERPAAEGRASTDELPAAVGELLDGSGLDERTALVFELLTVDDAGWPHAALLSVGEAYAPDRREVRFALWAGTRTSANLRRDGRGVLLLVADGAGYKVWLRCRAVDQPVTAATRVALFRGTVEHVTRDAVTYARLTSGPQISLVDPTATVAHWRETVALMQAIGRDG